MPLKKARLHISDYNDSRKRRVRSQERSIRMASLSLTSMVDMFAILVIFLLTTSSTVSRWIEVSHNIELPKAGFSEPPKKAASLQISSEGVFIDNNLLSKKEELTRNSAIISSVKEYLLKLDKQDGYVNIVADEKVAFGIIKRVVATCQEAGFPRVNLAVQPTN